MEFVWGRYSGLFYTGTGSLLFVGLGILFGSFWFFLAAGLIFLFVIGLSDYAQKKSCLLYTSPSPRDMRRSRMPSSA